MPIEQNLLTESYWPAEGGDEEVRDCTSRQLLREAAKAAPDRLALVDGVRDPAARRTWTYVQFLEAAERAARALLRRFVPGDRIAIWAPNSTDWIILRQGIGLAGMVMVAVNPAYRAQLGYILRQSRAAGLFYAGSYRDFAMTPVVDNVVVPQLPEFEEAVSFSDWQTFLGSGDPLQELPRTTACLPPNARGSAAEAWPIRLWRLSDDR